MSDRFERDEIVNDLIGEMHDLVLSLRVGSVELTPLQRFRVLEAAALLAGETAKELSVAELREAATDA